MEYSIPSMSKQKLVIYNTFNMRTSVNNIIQLKSLGQETLIYAVIIASVTLLVAFIISSIISFDGGRYDHSYKRRRFWFILIGIISAALFFLYNELIVMNEIVRGLQRKFTPYILYGVVIIVTFYYIVGFLLMKTRRKSKFGSILGLTK